MTNRAHTLAMGEAESLDVGQRTIQAPFGKALVEAGHRNPQILGLTADLGKYTDIFAFRDCFPDRFFNMGMAEQNLIAAAAGLARSGWIPFCTTYGVFATRRAYDFIAIACAHSRLNVKIVAGLPGLTTGYGGTHQAIEDLALARAIPNLIVIDPCDATEIMQATAVIAEYDGPVYMRLLRGDVPVVFDSASYHFTIGRAVPLCTGTDIGIVATGFMTGRALTAAATLETNGIRTGVLHVPTIKPFDATAVCDFASGVDQLITAENHLVNCGLGSIVADTIVAHGIHRPLRKIGLPDHFIECGSVPYLQTKYRLRAADIVAVAMELLNV